MGEVFDTTPENVLMHLKNIYKAGELDPKSTAKDFLVVRTEGSRQVKRQIKHYNLDAAISVGYRVNVITSYSIHYTKLYDSAVIGAIVQ